MLHLQRIAAPQCKLWQLQKTKGGWSTVQELRAKVSSAQASQAEMLQKAQEICSQAEERAAGAERRADRAEERASKAEAELKV